MSFLRTAMRRALGGWNCYCFRSAVDLVFVFADRLCWLYTVAGLGIETHAYVGAPGQATWPNEKPIAYSTAPMLRQS